MGSVEHVQQQKSNRTQRQMPSGGSEKLCSSLVLLVVRMTETETETDAGAEIVLVLI